MQLQKLHSPHTHDLLLPSSILLFGHIGSLSPWQCCTTYRNPLQTLHTQLHPSHSKSFLYHIALHQPHLATTHHHTLTTLAVENKSTLSQHSLPDSSHVHNNYTKPIAIAKFISFYLTWYTLFDEGYISGIFAFLTFSPSGGTYQHNTGNNNYSFNKVQ